MKTFLVRLLAVIGGAVVLAVLAALAVGLVVKLVRSRVPARTVLELDLETPLLEHPPSDPIGALLQKDTPTVRGVVEGLEKAAEDARVVGLVARVGKAPLGFAQAQELRDAVNAFRARKKKAVAFAETFGEFSSSGNSYYLASAFDEVWLQPSGDIGLTGLIVEHPFLRGTLDKLGLVPRMDHRYEYKNAMNLWTERKFTPAHREATERVVSSLFSQVVRGIAQGRKLSEADVRALVDRGPLLGAEAKEARLVDGLAYRDEVYEKVKKDAGDGARLMYLSRYVGKAGQPHRSGKVVALIYGLGAVQRGKSEYDPVMESSVMGSDTVTAAFRSALDDEDVKAILFRVDSPGGSYVASDAIWREVVRARRGGKPVVVSMGDVAGSGGYFVAMAADKIVAQPGTITASIGVLAGKMLTTGLWDKLGISWDEVHTSSNAGMWTGLKDYSPAEWARFQTWLDRIYADFTTKVAEGRKLPKAKVLELAKGRIWTGEDAKALGLVDELGGYPAALRLVKQAAGIPEKEDVELRVYPRAKNPLEQLIGGGGESSEAASVAAVVRAAREVRPLVRRLRALGGPADGALRTPLPLPEP